MYPFRSVESKWQKKWLDCEIDKTSLDPKNPYYVLEMLPYPSGRIHMGHVRNYTLGDALARFKKNQGYDVLHPMGWDAFGLPAENAAIERGVQPGKWTHTNISDMREQLKPFGFSYDWEHEFATCDSSYYKHEQEMFITFFERGLLERKESWVNWDPVDQCVLANEQVVDGKGWRSGATVERRKLSQWFFKITHYADELQKCIDEGLLKDWPDKVTKMQTNWLDKKDGYQVALQVSQGDSLSVFVEDAEQLNDVYAVLIPADHTILDSIQDPIIQKFVKETLASGFKEEAASKQNREYFRSGMKTEEGVPIVVANWVLEAAFSPEPVGDADKSFSLKSHAKKPITKWRLRDWLVSRQRYWGCPTPMVHCKSCGVVPVLRENLPVVLPEDVEVTGKGNPLDHHPTWKHTVCPSCGEQAKRDTDTLDTFFESSWYFLRYISPHNTEKAFNPDDIKKWMPVNTYVGGIEHAVMHLLYARFFYKALIDCGYMPPDMPREPFKKLVTQGMVCHVTYKREDGAWLYPGEVNMQGTSATCKETGLAVKVGRSEKMSKSKRNTVEPEPMLAAYGADAVRLFVLSDTPPDKDLDWNEEALEGSWRYMNKLWRLSQLPRDTQGADDSLRRLAHRLLKSMTQAYEQMAFNKVIAWHRELTNAFEEQIKNSSHLEEIWHIIVQTIAPIAPHIAHELWGDESMLAHKKWPDFCPELAKEDAITVAVQVNGKMRGTISVDPDASDDETSKQALALETVQNALQGKEPKRVIVVRGRIVNIVI